MTRPRRAARLDPPLLTTDHALDAIGLRVPIPAGYDRLSVSRVGPSGNPAFVRGFQAAPVTPGATISIRDFEVPLGLPVTYTVTVWNAAVPDQRQTVTTGPVTLQTQGCDDTWLVDLIQPQNTQRIVIERLDELAFDVPEGVHWILGRHAPIVTVDLAKTPTFELNFITDTFDSRDRAKYALGNGSPVLLRTPPENGIGNLYLFPTEWKEQRIVNKATLPDRRFVVSAVQVDRPDPTLWPPVAPATWATVVDDYPTWADLIDNVPTWDAVQWDYTHSRPTSLVPWPPTDV